MHCGHWYEYCPRLRLQIADILSDPICIEGCSLCIKNCPVQALDGTTAVQKKCRMNSYGKTDRGFDTVDCNKCRKVCPRCYGISK